MFILRVFEIVYILPRLKEAEEKKQRDEFCKIDIDIDMNKICDCRMYYIQLHGITGRVDGTVSGFIDKSFANLGVSQFEVVSV